MGAQRTKWRDIKDSDSHINSPPADSIGHLSTEQQKSEQNPGSEDGDRRLPGSSCVLGGWALLASLSFLSCNWAFHKSLQSRQQVELPGWDIWAGYMGIYWPLADVGPAGCTHMHSPFRIITFFSRL